MILPAVRVKGVSRVKGLGSQNPKATALCTKAQRRAGRCLHVQYGDFCPGDDLENSVRDIDLPLRAGAGLTSNDTSEVKPADGPLERPRQCRWRPGRRLLYPDWNYLASKHLLPVSKAQPAGSGRVRRGPG